MRFTPPDETTRRAAIGPTDGLPPVLRRALEPDDAFAPVPVPGPDDWLANHDEPGETFAQFVRARRHRPDARRRTLYLQPLGAFAEEHGPPLDDLRDYAAAFFRLPVSVLAAAAIGEGRITTRQNPHTGTRQLLTGDLLALLRERLPADAFALLGVTMEDLYPDPRWNFVFGQASLRERVGVYSFARYDSAFPGGAARGGHATPGAEAGHLLLRRSCKVLTHEMTHMFGVRHCTFFHCLMNGSNHLAESDARPMHLCPVDLRKLHDSVGFGVVERYRRLRDVSARLGFVREVAWLERQIARAGTA